MTVIVPYSAANWSYTTLQSKIADWLHRTDLTALIPDFITLAETRINGDIDLRLQDKIVTLVATSGVKTIACPPDVVSIRSLTLQNNPNYVLKYVTPDAMNKLTNSGATEIPQIFTIVGGNIVLGLTPDASYSLECMYKSQLPSLAANSTNWLLERNPDLYLFAALVIGARYCVWPDDRINQFEASYQQALRSLNAQDWYSGSTMQVRAG